MIASQEIERFFVFIYLYVMKQKVVLILVTGIMILLILVVIGDFYLAIKDGRVMNKDIIHLLQITITGLVAIIGTYFGMNTNKEEN